jgi:hypothetical protein
MICHQYRCIFVHVPKVAGTSIARFLDRSRPHVPPSDPPFDPDDDNKFQPPPPHLRAVDYIRYGLATREQFDSYFKFAFVRNPFARLVSEYRYRLLARKYDFNTWVLREFPRPAWNDQYCHVLPQYDFVHDQDGRLLVDFLGRFENLTHDFQQVCRRLRLPSEVLPRINSSSNFLRRHHDHGWVDVVKALVSQFSLRKWRNTYASYRDYYNAETRSLVAELYRKDLETFGYEF